MSVEASQHCADQSPPVDPGSHDPFTHFGDHASHPRAHTMVACLAGRAGPAQQPPRAPLTHSDLRVRHEPSQVTLIHLPTAAPARGPVGHIPPHHLDGCHEFIVPPRPTR